MITQNYDDWKRMLLAVAAARMTEPELHSKFSLPILLESTTALLNSDKQFKNTRDLRGYAVACALGIWQRKRLEWRQWNTRSNSPLWHALIASVHGNASGASVHGDAWDDPCCDCVVGFRASVAWEAGTKTIRVSEHPTRESAIEHLERLLGREP